MTDNAVKTVHYVIVVHGIGLQRENETVMPVIQQFAAARHNDRNPAGFSLGLLTSLTAQHKWIELEGIPAQPNPDLDGKFWIPQPASGRGSNIRFVDFTWSEVGKEQHPYVGETVKKWSSDLLKRLALRKLNGNHAVVWIEYVLENLQKGVLVLQTFLNLRFLNLHLSKFSDVIFNNFLGDVELYGNFPYIRGRTVRLFHEQMADLHKRHLQEFGDSCEPQYTIIAHSLGTVLTLDAITYAHANQDCRTGNSSKGLDFPGYDGGLFSHEYDWPYYLEKTFPDSRPSVDWVNYLSSFVTLGSPIDKYLALWTDNYKYLNDVSWLDAAFSNGRSKKIRHFNYSDEQDPVGNELNILETTEVWDKLFEMGEDVIFCRYPIMGLAHVEYWNDYDLISRILDVAIDKRAESLGVEENGQTTRKKPSGHYVEWFSAGSYIKSLAVSYIVIPVIGWFLASITFSEVWITFSKWKEVCDPICENQEIPYLSMFLFGIVIYFTYRLMKLIIMWHLVLNVSRNKDDSLTKDKPRRILIDKIFEGIIYFSPILWIIVFLISFFPAFAVPNHLFQILSGLAVAISAKISYIYIDTHKKWESIEITREFSKYF